VKNELSSLLSRTVGMKDGSYISGLPVLYCSIRETGVFLQLVFLRKTVYKNQIPWRWLNKFHMIISVSMTNLRMKRRTGNINEKVILHCSSEYSLINVIFIHMNHPCNYDDKNIDLYYKLV
jgi:hypothetical protein